MEGLSRSQVVAFLNQLQFTTKMAPRCIRRPLQHYQEAALTYVLVKPAHLSVHKWIVEDQSAEDEHGAVEVLHFWFVNDGSQDQVARYEHHQDCKHYRYLHTRQSRKYQITMFTMRLTLCNL